ncbi:hypothetical protein JRQ81_016837 [Phrynocephalus forsythii]|uniref:Uncharacterized protein n=1 Tax=Phrynocephalus forsythii TaxID=171643 RepID=A0A9Q0XTX7_9SAUR|nr:hypothetical protein JRQ81_016837 [Phrynocephalus forsythii]
MAEPPGEPPTPESGENPEQQPSQGPPRQASRVYAEQPEGQESGVLAPGEPLEPSQPQGSLYQLEQPRLNIYEQQEGRGALYQPPQARGVLFQARPGIPDPRSGVSWQPSTARGTLPHASADSGTQLPPEHMPLSGPRGSFHAPSAPRSSHILQSDTGGHGPYQPHEPGYGLYQAGVNLYEDQIPDPGPRALAIKNAKAYL